MTDYYARVHGHFENLDPWSTGLHITSNQTRTSLLTTFSNAWIAAWTNGTYGLETLYHTDVVMDGWDVYELDARLKGLFKASLLSAQPGTSSDTPPANEQTTLVEWSAPLINKRGRGFSRLPGLVEGVLVNGSYTSTAGTRVKTAMQSIQTAIQADGSTIFVAPTNVKVPPKDGTPLYTKTVLTALRVSLKPGSATRRQNGEPSVYV
jgi:hypothetical protein